MPSAGNISKKFQSNGGDDVWDITSHFLASAGHSATRRRQVKPGRAAMGPNDKFDLVIRVGDVLDPSQSLRVRADRGGRGRYPGGPGICASSMPAASL